VTELRQLLDQLEAAAGAPEPLPSSDGWELVLAENIAYLVSDEQRWAALDDLRRAVGTEPEQILAAPHELLEGVVAGLRPAERIARLRRCAELAIAGAPWRAFPGIGKPGAERIELFTSSRTVLPLDSNGLRVLTRLGYSDSTLSYGASYRTAQAAASSALPHSVASFQRAYLLLRRHGQAVCRRRDPACAVCPIAADCPSAGCPAPLY